MTRDPIYEKHHSGGRRSRIYGAEYQTHSDGIYPNSLHDHDVPCAVCHVTTRASQMMIPGRNACPAGWTREYKGYLMAEYYTHHRTIILAWMKTLTTHEEPTLILTELCFISLKEYVAHFPVNLIMQEKSRHVQYALVEYKLLSITDFYTYWHHHINIRRL